ncbi:hypothetical protein VTK73DRAFT_875 [Phialemonium thermophilum]|uniref:Dienelactone hydrolase domain-containing protein n=1 Tax=Phialemonium thermophilum TaxID=223376 RepID=A0ABR3Y486_9PEZI
MATSEACARIPPVSSDYKPIGRYDTVAGFKTYITGSEDAKRAIIDVYDVFGVTPQTLQGADRLAAQTNSLVLVPDFFRGRAAQHDWFPADTPEKREALTRLVNEVANNGVVNDAIAVRAEIARRWPAVDDHVGIFGLCFGGKIAVLATGEGNVGPGRKFNVSGAAHPGRLDAKDAEVLTVPHICLASKDEPADVVAHIKEILSKPGKVGHVETYDTFHGWMGARADLNVEAQRNEYARGYDQVAEFFNKYL